MSDGEELVPKRRLPSRRDLRKSWCNRLHYPGVTCICGTTGATWEGHRTGLQRMIDEMNKAAALLKDIP